jgi:hypothetical protein
MPCRASATSGSARLRGRGRLEYPNGNLFSITDIIATPVLAGV